MRSLTINLDLEGSKALVIGCGRVGRRKLSRLLGTGAKIAVVEPSPSRELLELRDSGEIELHGSFSPEMLEGCRVVMAASGADLPREVLRAAAEGRLLLNSAGAPAQGSFTLPAVAEDGELVLSVSTGGSFPALSAAVAARLRDSFRGWGGYVGLLGRLRPLVLASGLPRPECLRILRRLAGDGELPELVARGLRADAMSLMGRLAAPFEIPPDFAWPPAPARTAPGARAGAARGSGAAAAMPGEVP
ncbi:MAG: bifunctional precorrin-2 dehydrogenase/sirohydrochlorin ferrochelatase [Deltaproteobacteria bacterium]|nr:bifunctional precorrin-2 dehydrogenase/sirohydrochlorin ferrochelatase [Deltaproteobacteria bacterium]